MPSVVRTVASMGAWSLVACLVAAIGLASSLRATAMQTASLPDAATASPGVIAAALLDESLDQTQRAGLARDAAARAHLVVSALTDGLPPQDEAEEYRRIPWVWRVAVAAGRTTDAEALVPLLDVSMPGDGQPLRDWQAVVLGGGIVMGLSQGGMWPDEAMTPWLAADATRARRWQRALTLAVAMADDPAVRDGTRYDALRMLAVLPWDRVGDQLTRYLASDVAELQLGAIGGLSDLQDPRADQALVAHAPRYAAGNRRHAINALLRTEARRALLRDALRAGTIPDAWLTPEQRARL